ncbi:MULTISPECIES: ATP-binding protein [Halorussus]|uniref:sensor histidine kinase n=1 Tax=Halorussus TaxID=1070314 RepID=UPI000E2189EE|nr:MULTISPECIES: ATP-binding protein [Halorussus]NHN61606.1 HAMP domain-containing histidine kinase [Halorussus sp. JP-T4]
MGLRLRTKFVVILVAITLVLGASVYVTLESYQRDAVAETRASVDETARLVADQIDASVRDTRDDVGKVASRPRAREFDESGRFLDAFLANSPFYAAQVVAANGTVVAFRGDVSAEQRRSVVGSDRGDVPYVAQALRGRTYLGDVRYVAETGKHAIVFSAPIMRGAEVEGGLVAAMYLDNQTAFDLLPPLETSSQTVEITGSGAVLSESRRTFGASVRSSAVVESTGWEVTVTRDRTALDARLRRLAASQAAVLGVLLLAMVGFGYWQYAVSLRQTERLLAGFDRLGEGDYDHTVSLRGGSEWEQMSAGFDELAGTLRAREAALRERQQRLEVLYRVLQHNLRNRMSVILNYADVVEETAADEAMASAARTIRDVGWEVTSLSRKARQIRNAIEADHERRPIEVTDLVAEVVADVGEEYPDVEVTASLPDSVRVLALPSLRLAVENVCENACEHNDSADPRVEVSVATVERDGEGLEGPGKTSDAGEQGGLERARADPHDRAGWVSIAVADNGPGIPEQDRTAIGEGRETDLEHASGLGLWLTYWVVDNSGGRLRFAENDPRGAVVTLELPRASPDGGADDGTAGRVRARG